MRVVSQLSTPVHKIVDKLIHLWNAFFALRSTKGTFFMEQTQLQATWEQIFSEIKKELSGSALMWVQPIRPLSYEDGTLILTIPTDTGRDWVLSKYRPILLAAAQKALGELPHIEIRSTQEVEEESAPEAISQPKSAGRAPKKSVPGQGNLFTDPVEAAGTANGKEMHLVAPGDRSSLNPKYTFDTFVTGGSNRFAHAAAMAVAKDPGKAYNPFFMYGGVGLGKTHLMHAIGNAVLEKHPEMRVLYVSSEQFTNEIIRAIQEGRPETFRQKYRTIDVLMVDDIQFISGKVSTQEEFFNTFNALHVADKQIIISSDRPPREVQKLEDRLRSRFEGGLITDIQAPDLETRIAILKNKAILDHVDVPNDVMVFIASRIDTNIRELEGALTRVVAYASLTRQSVTTEVVAEALKDVFPNNQTKEITLEIIQEIVAQYFKIRVDELQSKKRTREIALPRQIAMYLCRELTDTSLPQIGKFFGGRDHTTVLHAYDKISSEKEKDTKISKIIADLIEGIQKI